MIIPSEVLEWLKRNAYAAKQGDYWLLSDFPKDQIPDKLEIPMDKKTWQGIQNT